MFLKCVIIHFSILILDLSHFYTSLPLRRTSTHPDYLPYYTPTPPSFLRRTHPDSLPYSVGLSGLLPLINVYPDL